MIVTEISPNSFSFDPFHLVSCTHAISILSGLRTVLGRWIYFISRVKACVKACVIRRGRGLLANDNSASTFPGQQSFKRRAKVSIKVGSVFYTCHLRDHYGVDRWWSALRNAICHIDISQNT